MELVLFEMLVCSCLSNEQLTFECHHDGLLSVKCFKANVLSVPDNGLQQEDCRVCISFTSTSNSNFLTPTTPVDKHTPEFFEMFFVRTELGSVQEGSQVNHLGGSTVVVAAEKVGNLLKNRKMLTVCNCEGLHTVQHQ